MTSKFSILIPNPTIVFVPKRNHNQISTEDPPNPDQDPTLIAEFRFRMIFIIVPAAGMAALVHHDFTVMELFWTFSVYLEAVAIMPQLQMIAETGEAETITTHYLFMLGCYRYI